MFKRIVDRSVSTRAIEFVQPTEYFRLSKRFVRRYMKQGPSGQRFDRNGRHIREIDDGLKVRLEMLALKELFEHFGSLIAHCPESTTMYKDAHIELRVVENDWAIVPLRFEAIQPRIL